MSSSGELICLGSILLFYWGGGGDGSVCLKCSPDEGSMVRCQREVWAESLLALCTFPPVKYLPTYLIFVTDNMWTNFRLNAGKIISVEKLYILLQNCSFWRKYCLLCVEKFCLWTKNYKYQIQILSPLQKRHFLLAPTGALTDVL